MYGLHVSDVIGWMHHFSRAIQGDAQPHTRTISNKKVCRSPVNMLHQIGSQHPLPQPSSGGGGGERRSL